MDEKDLEPMTPAEYVEPAQEVNAEVVLPEEKKPAGLGVGSLVLGILSILLICIPVVPLLTALIGIILGGVGISKAAKGTAGGKGMSIAGLVMGIVCLVLGLFSTILGGGMLSAILVPSTLGYVNKSKQSAINVNAKNVRDAFATALVELDSEGIQGPGYFYFSSEGSLDAGVSADYKDVLVDTAEKYFYEMSDLDYFILVDNYSVVAAVCTDGDYVGRYPDSIGVGEDIFFYDACKEALAKY